MRYLTFSLPDDPRHRLGFLRDDRIIEVTEFGSVLALIDAGPSAWSRLASDAARSGGPGVRLDEVRLHAPIPRPRKDIVCLGLNYASHAAESAVARGRQPKI